MVYDFKDYKEVMQKNRKWIKIALLIVGIVVLLLLANKMYLRILELEEIGGLSTIYLKNLLWKIMTAVSMGVIAFLFIWIQNRFIKKNVNTFLRLHGEEIGKFFSFLPALAIGIIFFAMTFNNEVYLNALKFFNGQNFNIATPLFGNDVGYYIFSRPFLYDIYSFLTGLTVVLLIYTVLYYGIMIFMKLQNLKVDDYKFPAIFTHILIEIAIFIGVRIFGFKLKSEAILYKSVVGNTGANYVDVNVWLKYYRIMPYILIFIVILAVIFLFRKKLKLATMSVAIYPALFIIVGVIALGVQGLVVNPNEKDLESQYLQYNIRMTRQAYSLDLITSIDLPISELTIEAMAKNKGTVDSIRVLDYESAIRTNTQTQSNTLFYTFVDGDILNYNLDGKIKPIFISAREINPSSLPDNSYINRVYKYTHGYGVVINPLNSTNAQGQIESILGGLDFKSNYESLKVTRPQIYYGELTNDYVVVDADNTDELDYDGYIETRYDGLGGIKLTGLNRLLYAAKYGDLNLITSSYAKDATLLPNRQIVQRAQEGVPFLYVDKDPYIVLTAEGKLVWVLDAYTLTDQYPYAQINSGINYIRNSVKVLIDAYDGKVKYYIIDDSDPLINAYDSMYPGVFVREELPIDIKEHMKYPEFLFEMQTQLLKKYHLVEEEVSAFYSQQDLWNLAKYPADGTSGSVVDIDSYYLNLKLPEVGLTEELVIARPFTPASEERHNMVSWLNVRNSYENYGELILYRYPKNTNVFGPYQVEVKINQIDQISKDMTLWGQSGSDVYKGSLLVVPIGNSILYVEPIYIKAAGSSAIPEVREVVTGFQLEEQFIYGIGKNVTEAITNMFAKVGVEVNDEGEIILPDEGNDGELLTQLQQLYDDLYKQLDELDKLINSLQKTEE
ncbi:MAG: UPF0182 family protein [Clostridiales bacterium]|nr:UPF0182 family protein [Clostridiales bacterium]